MKNAFKIITIIFTSIIFISCEDFLDKIPEDSLTSSTTFSNYEGIKNYAWQFYEVFPGYSRAMVDSENNTDLGMIALPNNESPWIWQKVVQPTNSEEYSGPFQNIRAINILLGNIEEADISDKERSHWKSVSYFFKAYNYIELINKYGDIAWVENDINEGDEEILFGPRTSRDEVANKILELLQFAEANIKAEGDGPNTVNIHVVRALISRFGLREGTWRKYHGLSDAEIYLEACVNASQFLLDDFPNIMESYADIFTSESLNGKDGIILYKEYKVNQVTHNLSTTSRDAGGRNDLTKSAINMYLMNDGQTRWTSPMFQGDETLNKEFRNRDTRLYATVTPPYKVITFPDMLTEFEQTTNTGDSEYFEIMENISSDGMKALPLRSWYGAVLGEVPHFADNTKGQGWSVSYTGYQLHKFSTRLNENNRSDSNDAPIFRIGEIMLNFAEAKKELGEFDQTVCNQTINKLRNRGKVANLLLTSIPSDPTRDPEVDPEMWEIRRERAIELMGEGFRFDDLRRWKKMDYATERKLGMWIVKVDQDNKVPTLNNADAGYVSYLGIPPSPFPEYYYLYPIPTNQVILTNGAVEQNPGW